MFALVSAALAGPIAPGTVALADQVESDASKALLVRLAASGSESPHTFDAAATCESGAIATLRLTELGLEGGADSTLSKDGTIQLQVWVTGRLVWRIEPCDGSAVKTTTLSTNTSESLPAKSLDEAKTLGETRQRDGAVEALVASTLGFLSPK